MPRRASKGRGLAKALSGEIEAAVSKVIPVSKLPTSKDVKNLTRALKALSKLFKKASAGKPGRKPAAQAKAKAPKRRGRKASAKGCSVKGCVRPYYAKGMCASHYNSSLRMKKIAAEKAAGKPGPKPKKRGRPGPKPKAKVLKAKTRGRRAAKACSFPGCSKKHYAKGLCRKHYMAKQYAEKNKTGK